MNTRIARGQFVQIIGQVDLNDATGTIRYVHPIKVAIEKPMPDDPASTQHDVELRFFDSAGDLLFTRKPHLLFGTDHDRDAHRNGMIQENIPLQAGMKEIALFINGEEKNRFVAGELGRARNMRIEMGMPRSGTPNRRAITTSPDAAQSGITYTVQARPEGEKAWQTIAVGRDRPDGDVNMNQFPRAKKVQVRVLATNGFEEEVITEQEMTNGQ